MIASFVAEWVSGEGTEGPEAAAILWAAPDELAGLATTPCIAEVVESARSMRAARSP